MYVRILSGVEGVGFPAIPGSMGTRLLSVLYQLEQSQWWTSERLQQVQQQQLAQLLQFSFEQVPAYRERLQAAGYRPGLPFDEALFHAIPTLTRAEVQQLGTALHSRQLPTSHGQPHPVQSSGSTGKPVEALGSDLTRFFWHAMTLRDHLWHQRDFSERFAGIRPDRTEKDQDAFELPSWGKPVDWLFTSGPSAGLNSRIDVAKQWQWLQAQQPGYLLTLPSNLRELLHHAQACRESLSTLREVRTFGETVSEDLRGLVKEVLGVKLTDMYSSQEVGYLALQCPEHEHYHVQSETALVEVLDAGGEPCSPGEVGRVVVTPLQNFAMPLIRYEVGDFAEVGEPCSCGRGLPVLKRIVGRSRNMVQTPEGERYWPSFPAEEWMGIADIRQIQLVQHTPESIEVRLAMSGELSLEQQQRLSSTLQRSLNYPFKLSFVMLESIPLQANGKYEDFISLL